MLVSRFYSCLVVTVLALAAATGTREAIAQQADARRRQQRLSGLSRQRRVFGATSQRRVALPVRRQGSFRRERAPQDSSCVNCHQSFEVPHQNMAKTRIEWRQSIPGMCAARHPEPKDQYLTSVHGTEVMNNSSPRAAICSDCHTAHAIESPTTGSIKLPS